MTRWAVILATAAPAMWSTAARADRALVAGSVSVSSGLEVGDNGAAGSGARRARSRVSGGVEVRSDEAGHAGVKVVGVAEVEPRTSFGAEARALVQVGKRTDGYAGVATILTPNWLVGPTLGAALHIPVSTMSVFVEPSLTALPWGSDLVGDRPIVLALISLGLRFDVEKTSP